MAHHEVRLPETIARVLRGYMVAKQETDAAYQAAVTVAAAAAAIDVERVLGAAVTPAGDVVLRLDAPMGNEEPNADPVG